MDACVTEDAESLRKTVRDLLSKLREAEWQHQSDRVAFEVRCGIWGENAPKVGLLDTGTSHLLGMDFLSFWMGAIHWKG